MSTIAPRINITTKPEIRETLEELAKRDNVTISAKTAELVLIGLSLEEDINLSKLAESRNKTPRKDYIKHKDVWK